MDQIATCLWPKIAKFTRDTSEVSELSPDVSISKNFKDDFENSKNFTACS